MRRKKRLTKSESFHHHVYVVLLRNEVARIPAVRRANPRRKPELPCVYVGMTGLDPAERLANHRNDHKSSRYPREFAVRLMPELYVHLNPMPYEAALVMERDLAEDLRSQGFTVTGGH